MLGFAGAEAATPEAPGAASGGDEADAGCAAVIEAESMPRSLATDS